MRKLGVAFLLLFAFFCRCGRADDLTLYFIPSPNGLNWRTPTRLLRSFLGNDLTGETHDIGHADVELNCTDDKGQVIHRATTIQSAMTGASSPEIKNVLFKEKIGLGLFFHTFAGNLQTSDDVDTDLQSGYQTGRLAFVTYQINTTTCQRLAEYFDEYQQRGYGNCYGLSNRPRYGEGAGCSAFAESFVELAGLMTPALQNSWSRTIAVPDSLIGGEMTGTRVPVLTILVGPTRWARAGQTSHPLLFWDPDRMTEWVQSMWASPRSGFTSRSRGYAKGVAADETATPTPSDPIWLSDPNANMCGTPGGE